MNIPNFDQLLDSGVHFGHLRRKWNPKMAPYIFMERDGIHIIDLKKTQSKLEQAAEAAKQITKSGKKILFVATKKQAKAIVTELVAPTGMPYVTERWPGGMLTNFATIRKAIKKMDNIDKLMVDEKSYGELSKREKLQIKREKDKLEKNLGSIKDLTRLPSAIFVVDILKEHIAIAEAKRLDIQTFAMVDTNANPDIIDFPIPANDDVSKSIDIIVGTIVAAINEGLEERKMDKENNKDNADGEEMQFEEKSHINMLDDEEDATRQGAPKNGGAKKGNDAEKRSGTQGARRPRKNSK